jgi:hypothetical protein
VDYALLAASARLIVDTRNALGRFAGSHIFRLGAPQARLAERETTTA